MRLADEWHRAWRWLQNWLIVALTTAPMLYDQLELLQDYIPASWFKVGMAVLGALTVINNVRKKKRPT